MASTKKITLRSSDGEIFEVEESVAVKSQMLKHMIDDNCAKSVIPIPNVTSKVLAKVIEYCKKHVEANTAKEKPSDDELKSWDADFIKVDRATLFDLLLAANYLEIQSLMGFTVQTAADLIKEMTPEEVRKMFNIKNDFTLEEEEHLRRDDKWAFQ